MYQTLSEAQKIEYDRRKSVMLAAIPLAANYLIERDRLEILLASKQKLIKNKWLAGFLAIGFIIESIYEGPDLGTAIWVVIATQYVFALLEEKSADNKIFQLNLSLNNLDFHWAYNSGSTTILHIRELISNGYLDYKSESYLNWIRSELQMLFDDIQDVPIAERLDSILA
jgi:hypothetical protein